MVGYLGEARLLSPLEDLDSSVSANMIQILMLVNRSVQYPSTASDSYYSTDILCCPSIQQPQAEHHLSFVGQRQDKCRMLLFQCRSLRGKQRLICRTRQDGRMDFLLENLLAHSRNFGEYSKHVAKPSSPSFPFHIWEGICMYKRCRRTSINMQYPHEAP